MLNALYFVHSFLILVNCINRPNTLQRFSRIDGVSRMMVEKVGMKFVDCIKEFCEKNNWTCNVDHNEKVKYFTVDLGGWILLHNCIFDGMILQQTNSVL